MAEVTRAAAIRECKGASSTPPAQIQEWLLVHVLRLLQELAAYDFSISIRGNLMTASSGGMQL